MKITFSKNSAASNGDTTITILRDGIEVGTIEVFRADERDARIENLKVGEVIMYVLELGELVTCEDEEFSRVDRRNGIGARAALATVKATARRLLAL
jgi:hypothetical protein